MNDEQLLSALNTKCGVRVHMGTRFLVRKDDATEFVQVSDLDLIVSSRVAEFIDKGLSARLRSPRFRRGGARPVRDVVTTFLPGY